MDAYIVKAYRSAVGKAGKGGFRHHRSDDLAVAVLKWDMVERGLKSPVEDAFLFDGAWRLWGGH